ncbi:hypothetical protein ACFLYO_01195 [Chloroflexota bacterium]
MNIGSFLPVPFDQGSPIGQYLFILFLECATKPSGQKPANVKTRLVLPNRCFRPIWRQLLQNNTGFA